MQSPMYPHLHRLYLAGSLNDQGLDTAVDPKGWITQAEADQIRQDAADA